MARHRTNPTLRANVANSVIDGQADIYKTNVALAHPYHMGMSCSNLHKILSSVQKDRQWPFDPI